MNFPEGEILLVNKPLGWTSFDVVNKIRYTIKKKLKQKIKVGHAGTLDPLATGLLIICTGKATKLLAEFQRCDKVYTGTMLLGKTTPSYDLETSFDSDRPLDGITDVILLQTAQHFAGEILQTPPKFSALKVGGKAAYREARLGNPVELQPRKVLIKNFSITDIRLPEVDFEVRCSKGTYIRSLAHDFGEALGCGACLAQLTRTEIGNRQLADAYELNELITLIENS